MDPNERLVKVEENAKSNQHRLDKHDKEIEELKKTYSIMEKMDYRMGNLENNMADIKKNIQKGQEQKRYEVG